MLIYYFHPIVGGAERQCLLQAKKLTEMGYSVSVLTTWHKKLVCSESVDGIVVKRMIFEIPFPVLRKISLFFCILFYLLVNRKKYDMVHVHQFNALTICACFAKFFTGKKVVCKQACESPYSGFDLIENSRLACLYRKVIRSLDCLLAISRTTYNEAVTHGFENKVSFLPNGVFIPQWKWKNAKTPQVIFSGRLHPQKGADLFIRAAAMDKEISRSYILLGDGPEREKLEKTASGNTVFYGKVMKPEKFLENDGVFYVLPSRAEGLSNALLEAMARGIPSIVSSSVSGAADLAGEQLEVCRDFTVHENLILVPPERPECIYQALQYLFAHISVAESLSCNSRNFVHKNYSIENICSRLAKLYCKILGCKE